MLLLTSIMLVAFIIGRASTYKCSLTPGRSLLRGRRPWKYLPRQAALGGGGRPCRPRFFFLVAVRPWVSLARVSLLLAAAAVRLAPSRDRARLRASRDACSRRQLRTPIAGRANSCLTEAPAPPVCLCSRRRVLACMTRGLMVCVIFLTLDS